MFKPSAPTFGNKASGLFAYRNFAKFGSGGDLKWYFSVAC